MSDIFISYASEDRPRVRPLADALEAQGWSVWWDRNIPPGKTWSQVINEQLEAAKCVIVLWSRTSVASEWVEIEAAEAKQRGILVPALIDEVAKTIPLEFRRMQAASLMDWQGESTHPEFDNLVKAVATIVGQPVKMEPGGAALEETKEVGAPVVEQEREPPPAPEPPPPEPPAEAPPPPRPPPWPKLLPWLIGAALLVVVFAVFRVVQENTGQVPRVEAPPSPLPGTVPKKEIPKKKQIPKKIVGAPTPPKITPGRPTKTTPPKGMVLVPAEKFWMGCNKKVDKKCDDDEKRGDNVYVGAFSIDTHEVTVADYRKCVEAGKCSSDGLTRWKKCNWDKTGRGDHPINCVDWNNAKTYCAWVGKRLPTEAEWEKAARGTDRRIYPWGNQWDSSRPKVGSGGIVSVGSYPSEVSPYGVYEMAGNVWEWTSSVDKPYPYKADDGREDPEAEGPRVLRGGWGASTAESARTSKRTTVVGALWFDLLGLFGFRCAKTP